MSDNTNTSVNATILDTDGISHVLDLSSLVEWREDCANAVLDALNASDKPMNLIDLHKCSGIGNGTISRLEALFPSDEGDDELANAGADVAASFGEGSDNNAEQKEIEMTDEEKKEEQAKKDALAKMYARRSRASVVLTLCFGMQVDTSVVKTNAKAKAAEVISNVKGTKKDRPNNWFRHSPNMNRLNWVAITGESDVEARLEAITYIVDSLFTSSGMVEFTSIQYARIHITTETLEERPELWARFLLVIRDLWNNSARHWGTKASEKRANELVIQVGDKGTIINCVLQNYDGNDLTNWSKGKEYSVSVAKLVNGAFGKGHTQLN